MLSLEENIKYKSNAIKKVFFLHCICIWKLKQHISYTVHTDMLE